MGYLSCNAESAIATCDSYNWPELKRARGRRPKKKKVSDSPSAIREFTHDELAAATNGFSAVSFLGKGSHGSVYKAVLDDGKLVAAVKMTKLPSSKATPSFHDNEIEILSRVRHPHLVNLIGFCNGDGNSNKLIVVEYMPNGSLYDVLHSGSGRVPGWARRVRFALQVARAVQALHASSPPVIHRDIKSSNVLIDGGGDARLGDFGLALRGHVEDVRVMSTPPAGTLGYLDPGYLAPGDLSAKSDVFSFGILLLEIASGRRAIDVNHSPPSIVDWAAPLIRRGDYEAICDPRIGPPPDRAVARCLAVLAARCVRSAAEKRPAMSEVVDCLKAISKRANAPPMWNDLRRRVRCVEVSTEPLLACHREACDISEIIAAPPPATAAAAACRWTGKVSSEEEVVISQMVRSKSIGSFDEIKVGPELPSRLGDGINCSSYYSAGAARRAGVVAVKMPAVVRLSKSRSVGGASRGSRLVLEFERDPPLRRRRCDMSNGKLVISLDQKSDR